MEKDYTFYQNGKKHTENLTSIQAMEMLMEYTEVIPTQEWSIKKNDASEPTENPTDLFISKINTSL
jgi:hypothetical protein